MGCPSTESSTRGDVVVIVDNAYLFLHHTLGRGMFCATNLRKLL